MPRFPDHVLDAIREAVDVVDFISRYVPLKKSGRSFSACCPFHKEKTPSFHVWAETQTWKCFGCSERGSGPFSFLMKREGLTFPEAVRQLAEQTGIQLEPEKPGESVRRSRHAELRRATEWACKYFEEGLRSEVGAGARDYLKGRGVSGRTALEFRLGYAPPGWEGLLGEGRRKGFDPALLEEAGLVIRRDPGRGRGEGHYDRFRDRIVFPIADGQGRIIAFGARALGDEEPKYLNSPETPLFTKGRHLYALHLARDSMMKDGEGAVMEGYTDVVMAHQQGFRCAVAGLGTALTAEQAALISRYVRKVWLVYDGDVAGLRAAERAIPIFLRESVEARVALLAAGEDPFDLLREGGLPAFRAVLDRSLEAFDHLISTRKAAGDPTTGPGRTQILEELAAPLAVVSSGPARELYVRRVADALHVSDIAVFEAVAVSRKRTDARQAFREQPAAPVEAPESWRPPPPLERELVMALLGEPAMLDPFRDALGPEAFGHPGCRALVERLLDAAEEGAVDVPALLARLEDQRLQTLGTDLLLEGADPVRRANLERQGVDCIERMSRHREQFQLLEGLDKAADAEDEAALLRKLQDHHRRRATDGGRETT